MPIWLLHSHGCATPPPPKSWVHHSGSYQLPVLCTPQPLTKSWAHHSSSYQIPELGTPQPLTKCWVRHSGSYQLPVLDTTQPLTKSWVRHSGSYHIQVLGTPQPITNPGCATTAALTKTKIFRLGRWLRTRSCRGARWMFMHSYRSTYSSLGTCSTVSPARKSPRKL